MTHGESEYCPSVNNFPTQGGGWDNVYMCGSYISETDCMKLLLHVSNITPQYTDYIPYFMEYKSHHGFEQHYHFISHNEHYSVHIYIYVCIYVYMSPAPHICQFIKFGHQNSNLYPTKYSSFHYQFTYPLKINNFIINHY